MAATYQPPTRQDREVQDSKSQTVGVYEKNATVQDLLSEKGRDVYSIGPDETLRTVVETLRDRRIGALVVVDEAGGLTGILSERDIVRKLAETPGQTLPQKVGDIMTRDVKTCAPGDALVTVIKQMTEGRFRHMPVIEDGALVGMVTIGDVVHYRLTQLEYEALHLKQLITG